MLKGESLFKLISFSVFHVLSAFTDYFPRSNYCNSRFRYNSNPYEVDIRDTLFENSIINGANGGVIAISSIVRIVVEYCTFSNISLGSGYNGGSIYLSSSGSGFAISKTCAYRSCISSGSGHFMYLSLSSNEFLFNTDTSIIECIPCLNLSTSSPIFCCYGYQLHNNMNLSKNIANNRVSMSISQASNLSIKFSTIENNKGTNEYGIYYYYCYQNPLNIYLNYINNSTPHLSSGNIHSSYYTIYFELCIFIQNFRILFGGLITLSSCYISHSSLLQKTGSNVYIFSANNVVLNEGFVTETYQFTHYSSAFCQIPTPGPSKDPQSNPHGSEITPCATFPYPPTPGRTYPMMPTECNIPDPAQFFIPIYKVHLAFLTFQFV